MVHKFPILLPKKQNTDDALMSRGATAFSRTYCTRCGLDRNKLCDIPYIDRMLRACVKL